VASCHRVGVDPYAWFFRIVRQRGRVHGECSAKFCQFASEWIDFSLRRAARIRA